MALTDRQVKSLKPKDKRYSKTDSNGLSIDVMPTGQKSWVLTLNKNGKRTREKIGSYPLISLKEAREKARKLRVASELNLTEITMGKVVDDWFNTYSRQWSNEKYKYTVRYRLDLITKPYAHKSIATVTRSDIAKEIEALVAEGKIETANRCLRLINSVFTYAQVKEYVKENPCFKIDSIIPSREVQNMPSLAIDEMPEFWATINKMQMSNQTRYALMLFNYLAVRPSELVKAEWCEFDLEAGTWLIPAHRMKMKKEHLVPLSKQPLEILRKLHKETGHTPYVFYNKRRKSGYEHQQQLNKYLDRLGYKGVHTPHGFRASAITMIQEQLNYPKYLPDSQAGHKTKDSNGEAYSRMTYLSERTEMMQAWADYLDDLKEKN